VIITLVFEKNANFFAENCRKSQKIVIITSTPGKPVRLLQGDFFANNIVPTEDSLFALGNLFDRTFQFQKLLEAIGLLVQLIRVVKIASLICPVQL
jgi:hypothetical protein